MLDVVHVGILLGQVHEVVQGELGRDAPGEWLGEGDEFADTFTISGKRQQKEIKVTVTDSAKSYNSL